ncbi:MAG: GIY-YIG nuclease family protein [Patescibacteria group bacterium]
MNMHYVYIIRSLKTGKLYKGYSKNLKGRVKEHNSRKNASTKNGAPWKLIYYAVFSNKTDALREEKFLKSGKGKERLKFLLKETSKSKIN